ncbi:hypothetical protein M885DRAFT_509837 [Pelagophyceae sp. CCMP2097]|nr:hypothetical protein M885DRAFT_509837 [Pelagophyceae sp. CCMP2097]|mmetsp:Transcript_8741/g.28745  ORF Transcript_8741/g.28745 Transcript_8741/m.28745 type:complete len:779 (-) Transcript_8741:94-2430(-)
MEPIPGNFQMQEERDGARMSWGVWPASRLEATRIVVPIGCVYTPLKRITQPPPLVYDPIRCNGCGAVLNSFCQVDFRTKLWTCPFCLGRNHFPPHYAENISETNLPAELIPQFTTVEYELQARGVGPPCFLFVVDTCLPEGELDELKDSIQQTLNLLPEEALVGLITYGSHVMVHELGYQECHKSVVFRGTKEYAVAKVQELLHVAPEARGGPRQPQYAAGQAAAPQSVHGGRDSAIGRFLLPVSDCAFNLESILEDLQRDPWPTPTDQRPTRCTGVALSVAVGLLETAVPRQGARIMLFVGGPPTAGPGLVVAKARTEDMRSHSDIQKGATPHMAAALKFYGALAERASANSHVIDVFAMSLDQVGLHEMRVCVDKTGGLIVLGDSFTQSVFKESLRRVFRRHADDDVPGNAGAMVMGFAATLEIVTSREFKIAGAIGACQSLRKKSAYVADTEIGQGGTNAWSLGGVDPSSTLAIYFEVTNSASAPMAPHKRRYVQFVTQYQHASGRYRLRATTLCGAWHTDPTDGAALARSFDQEAAAVLMARIACHRTETEEVADILRWLDRSLIRVCAKFASYRKDEPGSFALPDEFAIYPQFMFNLRRSQFLQLFNSSPDEAAYYRMVLVRESTTNSLVMIQPTLLSYSFQAPATPVLLDASSVRADTILLLDTFFYVIVFHGETIAAWREQGYQDRDEHKPFRDLLMQPLADATQIIDGRFPLPRYIICDQNKSEARFLICKLNPSVTHNSTDIHAGQVIPTDDVSLKVFMEHLIKLACES